MTAAATGASRAEIGIIGGSGFYTFEGLDAVERVEVDTPFGPPSAPLLLGTLHGRRVAFLARHGDGHRLLPAEVPARANIWALKSLGVERLLSVSAVGSLQEGLAPLQAVVPDQLIDRTHARPSTFFGDGIVAHVGLADPFCAPTAAVLHTSAQQAGVTAYRGGTLVVIEGPAFSTRAESELFRAWGGDIIGMTALPEARLAREAELCYAALCFVTDYDVWRAPEDDVTADLVMERLRVMAAHAQQIVGATVATLPRDQACGCGHALDGAIVTAPEAAPVAARQRLAPILARAWGA